MQALPHGTDEGHPHENGKSNDKSKTNRGLSRPKHSGRAGRAAVAAKGRARQRARYGATGPRRREDPPAWGDSIRPGPPLPSPHPGPSPKDATAQTLLWGWGDGRGLRPDPRRATPAPAQPQQERQKGRGPPSLLQHQHPVPAALPGAGCSGTSRDPRRAGLRGAARLTAFARCPRAREMPARLPRPACCPRDDPRPAPPLAEVVLAFVPVVHSSTRWVLLLSAGLCVFVLNASLYNRRLSAPSVG